MKPFFYFSLTAFLFVLFKIYPPYHKKVYPSVNVYMPNPHNNDKLEKIDSCISYFNETTWYLGKDTVIVY